MPTLLKLQRRYTNAGDPLTGSVQVTESGSNTKVSLYADAAGVAKFASNVMPLDSNGMISVYVSARHAYRLNVTDSAGAVLYTEDNVKPLADHISASEATDEPGATAMAYASTITPVASEKVTTVIVGALTGAITVANPTKASKGKIIFFQFTQDGTGSRAITWGNAFSLASANGAGTANQIGATGFLFNGTKWVQIGGNLTFHAP